MYSSSVSITWHWDQAGNPLTIHTINTLHVNLSFLNTIKFNHFISERLIFLVVAFTLFALSGLLYPHCPHLPRVKRLSQLIAVNTSFMFFVGYLSFLQDNITHTAFCWIPYETLNLRIFVPRFLFALSY